MNYRDEVEAAVEGMRGGESGYVRVSCPACPDRVGKIDLKRSVSVNLRRGWYKCWRCDWRGRLPGFDDDFFDEDDGWEDVEIEIEMPSDYHKLPGVAFALLSAREYLAKRNLSPEVIEGAELGYAVKGKSAGRIIMPIHGPDGAWLGWVGRAVRKGMRPVYWTAAGMDRRTTFYNDLALDAPADAPPLIVTEGPFDALRWWPDAVACLGKPTPEHMIRLRACKRRLIIALDGDAWQESIGIARVLRMQGREAYALALPRGEDLDTTDTTLVREGIAYALKNKTDTDLRTA